jgi:hypothetical protein
LIEIFLHCAIFFQGKNRPMILAEKLVGQLFGPFLCSLGDFFIKHFIVCSRHFVSVKRQTIFTMARFSVVGFRPECLMPTLSGM